MATYTYVTDATREGVLARELAAQNAIRKAQGVAPITAAAFLAAQLDGIIDGWAARSRVAYKEAVAAVFEALPPEQQAKLLRTLPDKAVAAALTNIP